MRALHKATIVALAMLLLVCLSFELVPALSATIEEGFQYAILILGRYVGERRVAAFDMPYPFDGQLYFYSRLGMDLIFALLQPFATMHPFAAARMVMLIALGVYTVATVEFVSAQFAVPRWSAIAAVILAPVVFASAYFLNDSLPSAACVAAAMAISARHPTRTGALLTGLLLGLGACLRIDALFTLPFFALQLLLQPRPFGRRVIDGVALLVLTLGCPALLDLFFGTSLIKVLSYGRTSIALFGRTGVLRHGLEMGASAFQLAGFIIAASGLVVLLRRRQWRLLLVVFIPSLIYLGVYLHSLYEARYFLPIIPLGVGLVAVGVSALHRALLNGRALWLGLLLALSTLVWFAPMHAQQSEGLRPYTGQLRAAFITREWLQTLTADSLASIREIQSATAQGPASVVVSDDWNADRLTHFALLQAGYRPIATPASGKCRFAHEQFAKDGRRVLHVRPHIPFLGGGERLSWSTVVQPCWAAWGGRPDQVLFVSAEPYDPARFAQTRALTPVPPTLTAAFGQPLWAPFVSIMRTDQAAIALPDRRPGPAQNARFETALDADHPLLGLH